MSIVTIQFEGIDYWNRAVFKGTGEYANTYFCVPETLVSTIEEIDRVIKAINDDECTVYSKTTDVDGIPDFEGEPNIPIKKGILRVYPEKVEYSNED